LKALLLAAGMGMRLRPLTETIPKCLVQINGKALLSYWIELLVQADIKEILINTHYLSSQVNNFIEISKYANYITLVHEEKLLGTGGTLIKNQGFFEDGPVILIHSDNLSKFNMNEFIDTYMNRQNEVEITMMTFITDAPQTCGIIELDSSGIVRNLHEKVKNSPGDLANGAVYIISSSVIDYIKSLNKSFVDFSTEVLPHYIGKINTFHNRCYHRDIGNLDSLEKGNQEYSNLISISTISNNGK